MIVDDRNINDAELLEDRVADEDDVRCAVGFCFCACWMAHGLLGLLAGVGATACRCGRYCLQVWALQPAGVAATACRCGRYSLQVWPLLHANIWMHGEVATAPPPSGVPFPPRPTHIGPPGRWRGL